MKIDSMELSTKFSLSEAYREITGMEAALANLPEDERDAITRGIRAIIRMGLENK